MLFKAFFNSIKKIIKNDNQVLAESVPDIEEEPVANDPVHTEPVTYDLKHGNNTIIVRGKEVIASGFIPDGKHTILVVEPEGKITMYNRGGYFLKFITSESLDIFVAENDNSKFKLYLGSGHDKVVIAEDVIIDEIYGENGNDEIVNNGTVYHIYGGDGNDTIVNNGIVNSVYGEDGDDTIINNGIVGKYIDVGEGDDNVTNNADVGRYITGGNGNDKLVNNGNIGWSSNGFENKTGEINGILYVNGEKYSGMYTNDLMYQNGILLTGISPTDNKYYENGRKVSEN